MKRLAFVLLLSMLSLTACSSKKEEVIVEEPTVPDLSTVYTEYKFAGVTIKAIGPVCGFIDNGDSLEIHPYNNSPKHITMEKILLSDKPYWETIINSVKDSAVLYECDDFNMFTLTDGRTFGYKECDEHWAYVVKSEDLPSSYVKVVLERLCQQDT